MNFQRSYIYGDKSYYDSLKLLKSTALEIGKVDEATMYTREWLETQDFYKNGKSVRYILDQPRGNGYWLWKIFLILR